MVLFTVSLLPFGVLSSNVLSKRPIALAFTLMVIVAFDVEMFVRTQVIVWPFTSVSPICFAPMILMVPLYSNPSSKVSMRVKVSV